MLSCCNELGDLAKRGTQAALEVRVGMLVSGVTGSTVVCGNRHYWFKSCHTSLRTCSSDGSRAHA
jgi:hypothetical protein